MKRIRYALVGTGSRSFMYTDAVFGTHSDVAEMVAFCDTNQTRMDYANEHIGSQFKAKSIATYKAQDFDRMIAEQKPEKIIVTSMDRTHHKYICRAMELGCDVITEKPLTTDEEKLQQIIDTVRRTGRDLRVTFNYRYAPRNSKVKEILDSGEIGKVLSVHFEWLLDTQHGADYFRRWHRDKANNGGLLVHKSTHHFDLMNWWLDSQPDTVFAFGRLAFYGRQNAEERGITDFYERAHGSETAKRDPFALHLEDDARLARMYLDAEHEDGYHRDQSVFGYNISTEDTISLLVRYRSKATMSYSLTAYSPWEGYRVMFNGTRGRLEANIVERSYVSGRADDVNRTENREAIDASVSGGDTSAEWAVPQIIVQRQWEKAREVPVDEEVGGHGGGDARLLRDIFVGGGGDPLHRAAGYIDGAWSILTGISANRSIATGTPVKAGDLVRF
ncbi:MAG TPA: Gfo/Idh/MocA family oxidoreductase [Spirochaetia bacterium]|nr:Gfo/Idh/MocA family oxidoreductase [Spirochaetia bacterium]